MRVQVKSDQCKVYRFNICNPIYNCVFDTDSYQHSKNRLIEQSMEAWISSVKYPIKQTFIRWKRAWEIQLTRPRSQKSDFDKLNTRQKSSGYVLISWYKGFIRSCYLFVYCRFRSFRIFSFLKYLQRLKFIECSIVWNMISNWQKTCLRSLVNQALRTDGLRYQEVKVLFFFSSHGSFTNPLWF